MSPLIKLLTVPLNILFLMSGCSNSEEFSGTDLELARDQDNRGYIVIPTEKGASYTTLVRKNVLGSTDLGNTFVIYRQPMNYYRCSDDSIAYEIEPVLEVWEFDKASKEVRGPVDRLNSVNAKNFVVTEEDLARSAVPLRDCPDPEELDIYGPSDTEN